MRGRLLATVLCAGASLGPAAAAELGARGAALFAARCADVCHQTPQAARLTARQWQVVLSTMQTRIAQAGQAPLTDEEQRAILRYLTTR